MQRSLYNQALRMHGRDLLVLLEKNQAENCVFVEDENEEQPDAKAAENYERESAANEPDQAPPTLRKVSAGLTGTMRDLLPPRVSADSSTEDSSRSDTSPEILPLGVPRDLHEPFEDDAFTSRLQNFISQRADILFRAPPPAGKGPVAKPSVEDSVDLDYYATLPPVEQFMDAPADLARKRLFEILGAGDVVAGSVIAIKEFGMFVRVVCLCGKELRFIHNCDVVGLLPKAELGDRFSQKAELEDFRVKDVVRCSVIKTDAANEKVILTMKNEAVDGQAFPLGIINESEFPVHFRRSQAQLETRESYDEMLDNTLGFDNPYNVAYLASMLRIDDADPPSFLPSLQSSNFPEEEHAESLRKWQSHKWAMESVARGVEHFKASRHLEAMQQLNRALEIDPENVEGLVARGALFANQNNLSKAIKDFAEAMRIKPAHKNANRYMCQTLFEKGKQCEESGEKEKAVDCYQSAVDLNPEYQDAQLSLERLRQATRRKSVSDDSDESPGSMSEESPAEQMSAKQLREMIEDDKKSSKKKKKKDKNQKDLNDGKGDRKSQKEKKVAKKKKKKKQRQSLSPVGKAKDRKKAQSSDSESDYSSPEISLPKDTKVKMKRSDKVNDVQRSVSPEPARIASRKRARNGSISPQRRSRSKTRKADLIRKKSLRASDSSTEEEKQIPERSRSKKEERGRSEGSRDKVKSIKKRSRKESEVSSSSSLSPSPQEYQKKSKKDGKDKKPSKDELGDKRRKSKGKKEKPKTISSPSESEQSSDTLSHSPMRKKSRNAKPSKKKLKKASKRLKKRTNSASADSSASESDKKVSPMKKVHKRKKKNKKKQKKRERERSPSSTPSVVSSESQERKAVNHSAKKSKHKISTKSTEHPKSSSSSGSSSEAVRSKTSQEKITKLDALERSPHKSERRSRSVSVGKSDRKQRKCEEAGKEVKLGTKRSRSNEYSEKILQSGSTRKSSKDAGMNSPEERRRPTKGARHSSEDSETEQQASKRDTHREKVADSPKEPQVISEDTHKKDVSKYNKDNEGRELKEANNKRQSRSQSPHEYKKKISKERRKSDQKNRKKSRESSSSSSSSKSPSPARKSKREKTTVEDPKQKPARTSRRSTSRSPTRKKEDTMDLGTPVRERKRKRSESVRADLKSPEKSKHDRKSKYDEEEKEERKHDRKLKCDEEQDGRRRQRKESGGQKELKRKSDSSESDNKGSPADSKRTASPRERKKSDRKRSPSPTRVRKHSLSPGRRKGDHQESKEGKSDERDSRRSRNSPADPPDRTQRSKSGSYDRERESTQKTGSRPRDEERRISKDGDRRRSGDHDRKQERNLSGEKDRQRSSERDRRRSGERERHRSSEKRQKSIERDRPRSREDDRMKDPNSDTKRRSSQDGKADNKDRDRDTKSKEKYRRDQDKPSQERSQEPDRTNHSRDRDKEDRPRDKDDRSKDSGRRASGGTRELDRRERSSDGDERRSEKLETKKQDKASERDKSDKKPNASDHLPVNIKDIPMPPDQESKPLVKKEPSPIQYVTSGSCKDEIIKVKSKWDTDSEDDDDAPGSVRNRKRGGGGGPGTVTSYSSQNQPYHSGGAGGGSGGQGSGGYNRCADFQCNENILTATSITNECSDLASTIFTSGIEECLLQEPLRLRGGCVASPPKYDDQMSDSEFSYSSSSVMESEDSESNDSHRKNLQSEEPRQKSSSSSSSDTSVTDKGSKRFKPSRSASSRSQSRGSSRSSSSSRSFSSGSSSSSFSSRSRSRSSSSSSSSSSNSKSSSSKSWSSRNRNRSKRSRTSSSPSQASEISQRSRGSTKKSRKRRLRRDSGTASESSDSGDAGAYMLWDTWEDYMDSRGHDLGKKTAVSSEEEDVRKAPKQREQAKQVSEEDLVDNSSGKSCEIVHEAGKMAEKPDSTFTKTAIKSNEICGSGINISNKINKKSEKAEYKTKDLQSRPQISNAQVRCDYDISKGVNLSTELSENPLKRHFEESRDTQKQVDEGRIHSRQGHYHRSEYGDDYRTNRNRDREHEYGDRSNNRHRPSRSDHHGHHSRSEDPIRGTKPHRRSFPSGDSGYKSGYQHRRYHETQVRGKRGERFWRTDDDWGRGVTEIQESNGFFCLVSLSKEDLVAQLYKTCSTASEQLRHKNRSWWL